MFKKTIIGAGLVVAATSAALIAKVIKDRKNNEEVEDEEEKDNNEVHFIKIDDDEEEIEKKDASDKSNEVQEVCEVYPYLEPDFVEELLNKNDSFSQMYEEDSLVQIVHHVSFESHDSLESFVDIMETAGYECECVSETEVTASKKMFVEMGSIISEILNVANQTVALNGKYESQEIR